MNRLYFILVIIVVFINACSQVEDKPSYSINLELTGETTGKNVNLYHYVDNEKIVIDSGLLEMGKLMFNGTLDGLPEGYFLEIDDLRGSIFFFLENSQIRISAHIDSIKSANISGSTLNTRYNQLIDNQQAIRSQMRPLFAQFNEAEEEGNQQEMDRLDSIYYALEDQLDNLQLAFIRDNSDNILGPYQATRIYYLDEKADELDSLLKTFDPTLSSSKYVSQLKTSLAKWSKLKIGMTAPDFEQNDSTGSPLKLSDLRGKYVLVDFWASWCGPCRAENPNIVEAYQKYKNSGFDILGVSLDTSKDKWLAAIEADNLTWNHVSDLNGWENEVSTGYGIQAIPYSLLIDPEGKIIGKNLREAKLHEALEEVLEL